MLTWSPVFDGFSKLSSSLATTGSEVTKFSEAFVKPTSSNQVASLDWTGFKSAIDNYKGDNLAFDKFKVATITRNEITVKIMVDKVIGFIQQALSVTIAVTELTTTIEATFTDLKSAKAKGWADFSQSSTSGNSYWEYRAHFALPNPDLAEWFYSLVATIK